MRRWIHSASFAVALTAIGNAQAQTPVESPDTPDVSILQPIEDAIYRGDRTGATQQLMVILDDETQTELHAVAWARLGDILAGYQLSYAAVLAWRQGFELDLPATADRAGRALEIADEFHDETLLGAILGSDLGVYSDPEVRSQIALAAGREALRQGELGMALGMIFTVSKDSAVHTDAEVLRGVVLAQQGRFNDALIPLLSARAMGATQGRGDRFRNVVELNLARAYFGAQNWGRATQYYGMVDRGSHYWPEAAFEAAWAHFRGGDMPGALAQLHSLQSPFFEDWYFAEADLLRIYALFMLCKFPDASDRVDVFVDTYTPWSQSLAAELSTMTAAEGFADARAALEGNPTRLPHSVLRRFTWEDRFSDSVHAVDQIGTEIAALDTMPNLAAGPIAREWLVERRTELIAIEGERVLDAAQHARDELRDMLEAIKITKLDILGLEAALYERASRTGSLDFGDPIGKLRTLRRRGVHIWPFQGEYWADELGWYHVDSRSDCPPGMGSE